MICALSLLLPLALGQAVPSGGAAGEDLVIAVDRLHVGDGRVLENAVVVVADGLIRSVVAGGSAAGAHVHVAGAELSPGLFDAYSYMGVGAATLDQTRESTPSMRVARTAELDSAEFRTAVVQGVTGAYLSPDSLNVFGGIGAVVKTHGGESADLFADPGSAARVIVEDAALKVTMGSEPSSGNRPPWGGSPDDMNYRRPTTRMGVERMIRSEFHRAARYRAARAAGAGVSDPGLDALVAALDGELPLRIQARKSQDLQALKRLQEELQLPPFVIEEGTEAYRCIPVLQKMRAQVVTGPLFDDPRRAVVRPLNLAEWRTGVRPPQLCCEDEDAQVPERYRAPDTTGHVHVSDFALDLLSIVVPGSADAQGLFRGRRATAGLATPALPALLAATEVPTVLGAAEAHGRFGAEASLIHQARRAVEWGLEPALALPAVTLEAARLCGVQERLGSIEVGKDADLVLWSGPPLAADSRPILVLVDGVIAFDARPQVTF
ncbi:MAG TPA: amidohydrolase family protein [Planctomycetota bacterium]